MSVHELLAQLRRQPFDLRLEVILVELLDYGCKFDKFLIQPMGLFARRYRRDLGEVYDQEFEGSHLLTTRTVLELHREGIYDALPQHIFHQPGDAVPDTLSGVQAMIKDSEEQQAKEKATRLFFLPFEQEFFRLRINIEQEEKRYYNNISINWYSQSLARFWGIADAGLPLAPLINLLHLLPLAHGIVGDLPRTQMCFEAVLGQAVKLQIVSPLWHTASEASIVPNTGTLNNFALGCDLVLGGDYKETIPALEITLTSLSVPELEAYLAGQWPSKALSLLCDYFVAFETDVVVRYEMDDSNSSFYLEFASRPLILLRPFKMGDINSLFYLGLGKNAPVLGYTTAGI